MQALTSKDCGRKLKAIKRLKLFHTKLNSSLNMQENIYYNCLPEGNVKAFTLDGSQMKNIQDFLSEISQTMNFPKYFGNNYNALLDCLQDLAWIEAQELAIIINNADDFLSNESQQDFQGTIDLISDAIQYWKSEEEHRSLSLYINN